MKRKVVLGFIVIVLVISVGFLCLVFFPSPTKQPAKQVAVTEKKMKKIDKIALVATGQKKGNAEYRIAQDAKTREYHVVLARMLPNGRHEILEDLGTIE